MPNDCMNVIFFLFRWTHLYNMMRSSSPAVNTALFGRIMTLNQRKDKTNGKSHQYLMIYIDDVQSKT